MRPSPVPAKPLPGLRWSSRWCRRALQQRQFRQRHVSVRFFCQTHGIGRSSIIGS